MFLLLILSLISPSSMGKTKNAQAKSVLRTNTDCHSCGFSSSGSDEDFPGISSLPDAPSKIWKWLNELAKQDPMYPKSETERTMMALGNGTKTMLFQYRDPMGCTLSLQGEYHLVKNEYNETSVEIKNVKTLWVGKPTTKTDCKTCINIGIGAKVERLLLKSMNPPLVAGAVIPEETHTNLKKIRDNPTSCK